MAKNALGKELADVKYGDILYAVEFGYDTKDKTRLHKARVFKVSKNRIYIKPISKDEFAHTYFGAKTGFIDFGKKKGHYIQVDDADNIHTTKQAAVAELEKDYKARIREALKDVRDYRRIIRRAKKLV